MYIIFFDNGCDGVSSNGGINCIVIIGGVVPRHCGSYSHAAHNNRLRVGMSLRTLLSLDLWLSRPRLSVARRRRFVQRVSPC